MKSINIDIDQISKFKSNLILITSEKSSFEIAVFIKNDLSISFITISREILQKTKGHNIRGVIANAQCANTFIELARLQDTIAMSREADKYVVDEKKHDSSVLMMHTGVGGQRYNIRTIAMAQVALIINHLIDSPSPKFLIRSRSSTEIQTKPTNNDSKPLKAFAPSTPFSNSHRALSPFLRRLISFILSPALSKVLI